MANYLILGCDEITELVVNPGENTLTPGSIYFIEFTGETTAGCFRVVEESSGIVEEGVSSSVEFDDCLLCLQNNGLSFLAVSCDDPEISGPIDSRQFTEWPIGQNYRICEGEVIGCLCVTITGITNDSFPIDFNITGPFTSCLCEDTPRSANTESTVCVIDCSGNTVSIVPPHPIWTDGYGTQVTQLNMITLGGTNGLNS